MQKVITITTHTNIIDKEKKYTSKEYPELDELLNSGFKVIQVIPVVTSSPESYRYSLTFVLEK